MLRGEDSTKPKAETEDERKVKDFIQSAAVRARMQVKYVDRPLVQKAYYKDGVIYINKNRPLDEGVKVTVAHELYHAMEGTKEHDTIVRLAFEGKDAEAMIAEKIEKYRQSGVELDETGARAEIGAEFIEKALTDEATINQVLLEDRTLAAKILERIKEIIAVYKAKKDKNMSAAEAREYAALLKAKRLYEDGLEKLHKDEYSPAGVERERYQAIKQTPDGQKVVVLDQNVLGQRPNTMKKETFIKNYLVDLARNNPDVFARIEENGHKIYLDDNVLPNEYAYSKSAQNAKGEIKNIRERALSNLDEIIEVGSNRRFEGNRKENLQPKRADKKRGGMYKYDTKIAIPGENGMESFYDATVLIRYDQNGKRYLYDIVGIKKDGSPTTYTSQKSDYRMYEGVPSTNNIPNPAENVNSKSQKNEKRFALDERYQKEYADDNGISTIDIMRDLGYDGILDGAEVVVFSPEQVKSVDNESPTSNPDIRYSLDDGRDGERKRRAFTLRAAPRALQIPCQGQQPFDGERFD